LRAADKAGFEALIPVARWEGFGGATNFNGATFETYTWAAGPGGRHPSDQLVVDFSRSQEPPRCRRQTVGHNRHISNGRFALNVVCGAYQAEFEMFGLSYDHDGL
jgi:hypothetical protein